MVLVQQHSLYHLIYGRVHYERSHLTQPSDGCLFASGHPKAAVDTFK